MRIPSRHLLSEALPIFSQLSQRPFCFQVLWKSCLLSLMYNCLGTVMKAANVIIEDRKSLCIFKSLSESKYSTSTCWSLVWGFDAISAVISVSKVERLANASLAASYASDCAEIGESSEFCTQLFWLTHCYCWSMVLTRTHCGFVPLILIMKQNLSSLVH